MRQLRGFIKNRQGGAYLHVYNHITSEMPNYYPLNESVRHDIFLKLSKYYQIKYNIEVISFVCMGNHFHLLVYCPEEKFSPQEAADAYNIFSATIQPGKRPKKPVPPVFPETHEALHVHENCNNISEYMRELQRGFTLYYNERCGYKRNGHLWQDRFRSQLIESAAYLWTCLKYVEMNPVRAKIATDAGEYSGSSYGAWTKSGQHPYADAFLKHIVSLAQNDEEITLEEFYPYMKLELATMQQADEAKVCLKEGNIELAKEIETQIAEKCAEQEKNIKIQIVYFSDQNFHSKKFIGSRKFINKEYEDWLHYLHEFTKQHAA